MNAIARKGRLLILTRKFCSSGLVGRKFLKPTDFSMEDLHSLLWTAQEMKTFHKNQLKVRNVRNKKVALLASVSCFLAEIPFISAVDLLNMKMTMISDAAWEKHLTPSEMGKYLSINSDIVVCEYKYQMKLEDLAANCTVPFVNLKSGRYVLLDVLTHLMTFQSHYGYLNGLTIAWVGFECPLLNTYLVVMPKLRININCHCTCNKEGTPVTPFNLDFAKKECLKCQAKIVEKSTTEEAIDDADIIVVAGKDADGLKLVEKFKGSEEKKLIFYSDEKHESFSGPAMEYKNNLIWDCYANLPYMHCALILSLICDYHHITTMPHFSCAENSCEC